MPWLQLTIEIDQADAALAELALDALGALAVTLQDAQDMPILEPLPNTQPLWNRTRILGLFPATIHPATLETALLVLLPQCQAGQLQWQQLTDQPWERLWLADFQPMRFGKRLWICPQQQQPPEQQDAVVIQLDPGLAFGTGTHPTTALCLHWLDQAALTEKTVIDYGCGSGILAIAALKLGASRAIAVDHDPQALEATRSNAANNGVSDQLSCYLPEHLPPQTADLVIANILAEPLIALADTLIGALNPNGWLLLSGLLEQQIHSVTAAYHPTICFLPPQIEQEWSLLVGQPC